jgi:hypothetical protein
MPLLPILAGLVAITLPILAYLVATCLPILTNLAWISSRELRGAFASSKSSLKSLPAVLGCAIRQLAGRCPGRHTSSKAREN